MFMREYVEVVPPMSTESLLSWPSRPPLADPVCIEEKQQLTEVLSYTNQRLFHRAF